MRRTVAAALVLLMPVLALTAPLAHVHPDDHETPHHQGRARHAHFHGHAATVPPSGAATVPASGAHVDHEEEGERTLAAQPFVAVAPDPLEPAAPPSPVFTLVVAQESAVGRAPQVSHAHDPPIADVLGARPPPAF